MGPGLADHHAAPGMADKNRRVVLCIERSMGRGQVIGQRGQRVVDLGDM